MSFAYEGVGPVLDGVDLDVPAGGTLGIVGTSGSGKSTLLKLLLRLYEPQRGRILLDGLPLTDVPPAEVRRRIGLVPQDTLLFHESIAANIALGDPDAPLEAIRYAAKLASLHGRIEAMPEGYDTVVGERGSRLSGGERQRLAIARAILKRPTLFLLDEATSMLDPATEAALLRDLREAVRGCTTIMVAHRLSTVRHADDIVVMEQGRIVERGTHSGLLTHDGPYAKLWRAQQEGAGSAPSASR